MGLRAILGAAVLGLVGASAGAQTLIPERQMTFNRDVDFYGADLTNIFGTTLDACIRACTIDTDCKADTASTAINRATAQRDAAPFLKDRDLSRALMQAQGMGQSYAANGFTLEQFIDAARAARAEGNADVAMRFIGAAITIDDRSDL